MLRRTYDWILAQARTPHALWTLAVISFVESSVFPIPPDVLLIPMILAAPHRAWLIAGVCTLASVAGGMAGYAIGYFLFEQVGEPILGFYGYTEKFDVFRQSYNEWGAWAVLIAGVTPFPYKVITILSGVTALDIWVFTVASLIARALRFFLIAALLWKFGPAVRDFIERRLGLVFTVSMALLLGGFVVAKVLI
ncbi:DedA family protein [Limibaculum sp. M0105]|uniref:DedA family protein n=1 Tax=Thermohalobaculum xanthum TaxID=2753746 RepID=A0A8J7M542_9RHOB|nr:YqaA family protein [Thermohalobaculum xanthum]MBK0398350.1 DedA family protein [Thermohalobaculum xanthum]